MELLKEKGATILVIVATVILAGVAVFTALRLFETRQEPITPNVPESNPEAASGWDVCRLGESTHDVNACRQRAIAYKGIAGPSDPSDSAWFVWAGSEPNPLSGDTRCGLAPSECQGDTIEHCSILSFTLTTPTPTPTGTTTPTPTLTSTPTPTDGPTSTPTPTSNPSSTPTPTTVVSTSTPTPTSASLPDAGVSAPTVVATAIGGILLVFSLVLAL